MTLSAAMILQLATQCAPNVAPPTVGAIVATESRGDPHAVNVNGGPRLDRVSTAARAVAIAKRYVNAGYSVDLGLGQINSRNMRRLGLTWQTVFDPCTNLAALGRVITENYEIALAGRESQAALRVAFSLYNTGSPSRGFRNGYVGRVVGNAGVPGRQENDLPPASVSGADTPLVVAENTVVATIATVRDTAPPAWATFARAAYARRAALPSATTRSWSVWAE